MLVLPESPRYLAFKGCNEEALQVLANVNGALTDDPDVQLRYHEIIDILSYETQIGEILDSKKMLKTLSNRKRLLLALSVAHLTMLTGSNVITYYFGTMLTQAGISSSTMQLEINLILSAWQLMIAVLRSAFAGKIGRRPLALLILGSCTVCFYLPEGLTARFEDTANTAGIYGTIACIFLFLGTYSFGLTPLTAMYAPEILPYSMRASGIALRGILVKICGVFVTFVSSYMLDSIGWKTYTVNASWNILIFVYVYFQWIETRGLMLEEIESKFDDHLAEAMRYQNEDVVLSRVIANGSTMEKVNQKVADYENKAGRNARKCMMSKQ